MRSKDAQCNSEELAYCFVAFSVPSSSSLLKLPINATADSDGVPCVEPNMYFIYGESIIHLYIVIINAFGSAHDNSAVRISCLSIVE